MRVLRVGGKGRKRARVSKSRRQRKNGVWWWRRCGRKRRRRRRRRRRRKTRKSRRKRGRRGKSLKPTATHPLLMDPPQSNQYTRNLAKHWNPVSIYNYSNILVTETIDYSSGSSSPSLCP